MRMNTNFIDKGSKTVFGEMWFHAGPKSVDNKCRQNEHQMVGTVAEIQNMVEDNNAEVRGDTLVMLAKLWDNDGNIRFV